MLLFVSLIYLLFFKIIRINPPFISGILQPLLHGSSPSLLPCNFFFPHSSVILPRFLTHFHHLPPSGFRYSSSLTAFLFLSHLFLPNPQLLITPSAASSMSFLLLHPFSSLLISSTALLHLFFFPPKYLKKVISPPFLLLIRPFPGVSSLFQSAPAPAPYHPVDLLPPLHPNAFLLHAISGSVASV